MIISQIRINTNNFVESRSSGLEPPSSGIMHRVGKWRGWVPTPVSSIGSIMPDLGLNPPSLGYIDDRIVGFYPQENSNRDLSHLTIFVEEPPMHRDMSIATRCEQCVAIESGDIDEDDEEYGHDCHTDTAVFTIPTPRILYAIRFVGREGRASTRLMHVFFLREPFSGPETKCYTATIPNLYATGGVCMGSEDTDNSNHYPIKSQALNMSVNDVISRFWNSYFNNDIPSVLGHDPAASFLVGDDLEEVLRLWSKVPLHAAENLPMRYVGTLSSMYPAMNSSQMESPDTPESASQRVAANTSYLL